MIKKHIFLPKKSAHFKEMLNKNNREILRDLMVQVLTNADGVDALKFRANHENCLAIIDELEERNYIERKDNKYNIKLLALAEFKNEDQPAESILNNCSIIFSELRKMYKQSPGVTFRLYQLSRTIKLPNDQVRKALVYLIQAPIWSSYTSDLLNEPVIWLSPSESILKYNTFDEVISQLRQWSSATYTRSKNYSSTKKLDNKMKESELEILASYIKPSEVWANIEKDYDITKRMFGKKIHFVNDNYKRKIIFRDIEHAFVLANLGFSKPAVILTGSIIEELLNLYLQYKKIKPKGDTFNSYIKACEFHGLLKFAIHRLTDSIRSFRNLVHLSNENSRNDTISKATAKAAFSSIFIIVNDF